MAVHNAWQPFLQGHGSNAILNGELLLLILAVLLLLYFLPSIKAWRRCQGKFHWCLHLFFINLFLGWTIVGWWHVWNRANWSGPTIFVRRGKYRRQSFQAPALQRTHHLR
ncbi:superinfection immunity protein [Acidithiobacillus sp. M4-SHS-6]|uniref:superinfection immunity protein n=1 Tax=Acidithiobacillus sp. M4-SHS-6 TaxID=3383024 RepID=UPI0039BDFE1B